MEDDDEDLAGLAAQIGAFGFGRSPFGARRARGPKRQLQRGGFGGFPRPSNARQRRLQAAEADLVPDVAGAPARDVALLPASWPTFVFNAASGTNIVQQTMNVQTAFRGRRLIGTVLRNGASALLTAPLMTTLQIGMKPILATPDGVAIESLLQGGFDNNLLFPPTTTGTIYTLQMRLPIALAGADTITCIISVTGSAIL